VSAQEPDLSTIARAKGAVAEFLHRQLAGATALPEMSFLAVAVGLLTGTVVLLFRGGLEAVAWLTGRPDAESFEGLGLELQLLMPIAGAIVLGLLLNRIPPDSRRFGVVHVMERLARHRGRLSLRSALNQFVGGIVGLSAGLSGGREGPAIHLGAATSSLLGQVFRLPDNCVRTLVACGSAAAIGASFNTPMAGVIFAMEVVMMEYAITSFIPIIIATVTATLVNRWFVGDVIEFPVPDTELRSLVEVPYIMVAGIVVGLMAGLFIHLVKAFAKLQAMPFWAQATIAGVITGGAAMVAPEVLGVGYDTVNAALLGNLVWTTLLAILVAKTVTSAACVGVGLPVGVIGPTIVMGALLGGLLGTVVNLVWPDHASAPALYVMLGMAAMMAAVLQAPLAALVAVLELTASPKVILPAMLIIAVAVLTASLFKQRSVLLATLATQGIRYPPHPAAQHLLRVGVASLMNRAVGSLPSASTPDLVRDRLAEKPDWIVMATPDGAYSVIDAADFAHALASHASDAGENTLGIEDSERAGVIDVRATLQEALTELNRSGVNALCVIRAPRMAIRRESGKVPAPVVGVLTRDDIEQQAWW